MSQLLCSKYKVFSPAPALTSSTVLLHAEQSATRSRARQVSTPTPGPLSPAPRSVSHSSPRSGRAPTALQYPPHPQTSRYFDPRQKRAGGPGAAAARLSSERGAGRGQRLPEQKRPRQRFSSQTQQVSAVLFVCRPSTTREGGGGGRWRALGCCPVSTARRGSPRFAGRWWPWLWCPHFWWALSSGCGVSQGVQCLNVH